MGEIILKIIGFLILGLIERIFESTGRRVLSWRGIKSNAFVETLVGVLAWSLLGLVLFCLGAAVLALIH